MLFFLLMLSGVASADEDNFYSSTSDGYAWSENDSYQQARDVSLGAVVDNEEIMVGQSNEVGPDTYFIYRGFVFFNTSSIPDIATITSATLYLCGAPGDSLFDDNFNVVVQIGSGGHPNDPLENGDFDRTHYSDNGGSFNTSTFVENGWNSITLNSTGMGWINKTGWTKFCLRSSKDMDGDPPGAEPSYEIAVFLSRDLSEENSPKLVVTYTLSEPTVSTLSPVDVGVRTAIVAGSLDSLGGYDNVEVWFQWRKKGTPSWAETDNETLASPSTFTRRLTGLEEGTTYEYRAAAKGSAVYGSIRTFITNVELPPPPPPPPPPPTLGELKITVETGTMSSGGFEPLDSFHPGALVFVRVVVTSEEGETTATVTASWDGGDLGMMEADGWYIGSFRLAEDVAPGGYLVSARAEKPGYNPATGSTSFAVTTFPAPPTFPDWVYWLIAPLLLLCAVLWPKDSWGETPRNWVGGSGPGTWTFLPYGSSPLFIIVGVSITLILLIASVEAFFVYLAMAGLVVLVLFAESEPKHFPAAIGLGGKKARLAAFGICFGAFFMLVVSWVGKEIGVASLSIDETLAMSLAVVGTSIPIMEETMFRGTIDPTLAEKLGIYPGFIISGVLFGLAHMLFGAGWWMFSVSTTFGVAMGYMALRHQSIIPGLAAHITYNSLIIILLQVMSLSAVIL